MLTTPIRGFRVALVAIFACALPALSQVKPLDEMPMDQLRTLIKGHMGDWRQNTDQSKGLPPPPTQKPVPEGAKRIALPDPQQIDLGHMPLDEAIRQRRSRRKYTDAFLTTGELSFLLWCTQGVSKTERDEQGRIVNQFRTVPSGGARHPFETYLLLNRVEGLAPGIYRFLPLEHSLVQVREEAALARKIVDACYGRTFVGEAAAVFVWAAVPTRTEWRYGPIAHRMIAIEAGHICQNLTLAAESIGAGACSMLGYSQVKMDTLIGVDGTNEFTVYLAPVGKIADEHN